MRLRSSLFCVLPLVAFAPACATAGTQVAQTTPDATAALNERLSTLEASNERQAQQITLLRGQLALAQAEAREARAQQPREVVRIGGTMQPVPPAPEPAWIENESPVEVTAAAPLAQDEPPTPPRVTEPSEPRPVLRLHGVGTMPLTGTSAVRESLPPGPAAPPTVASVVGPQAPLPFPPSPTTAPPVVLGRATPQDAEVARETYRVALAHVTNRRFDQALPSLSAFIERFPGHPYVDNALFWRATTYYAMRRYNEALADFQRVVAEFPNGNKVPDALLQVGMCYQRLGDGARARVYFERVRREYPQSVAARLAAREDTT